MGAGWSGGRPRFLPAMRGDCMATGSRLAGGGGEALMCPGAADKAGKEGKEKRKEVFLFIFLIKVFLFKVFQLEAGQPRFSSRCHLVIYC